MLAGLLATATVSIALRSVLAAQVHGPFVFMDELGYERVAQSLARTGHLALFSKSGLSYSPLYPIVLAPVYALASSAQAAYEWAKVENAVLMSLSVFPVYGIARFVLSRLRSMGVAALSLAAPLMFYTSLEMSESLAYPVFLVAIWAMLRAVSRPSAGNDALLLGSIVTAGAARVQLVVLLPAALTAVLLLAVLRPEPGEHKVRSISVAVGRHRLLTGAIGVITTAAVAWTLVNGGRLPLAGRYSDRTGWVNPLRVAQIAWHHLAELDLAMGVVPFAGALLGAYALVHFGFPRRALVFGTVALSTTLWMVLVTAVAAAEFDAGGGGRGSDLPRIHERYLIYVAPLFLVAMVAALRAARPRIRAWEHLLVAAAVALLPATIPFSSVINRTIIADSFGLEGFGRRSGGDIVSIPHPVPVALVVGGIFALAYLYALVRPRPSFAVVMTVVAFLMLSALVRGALVTYTETTPAAADRLAHVPWVDRAVGGSRDVVVVGGKGARVAALANTAFQNLSISRLYYTCKRVFGADFGEQRVAPDSNGRLSVTSGPVNARYAVVPEALGVSGRVLAREQWGHLVLIAPQGGVLRIPPNHRGAAACRN